MEGADLVLVALDESVERFLADCKPGSAGTYHSAMKHFTEFIRGYKFQDVTVGTPSRFLDLVSADQAKPRREKQFIARAVIRGFREYLEGLGLLPKSVLTIVSSLQSYGKYYEVTLSTKFTQMPAPLVQTKSYPWTTEVYEKFLGLMETPMYRLLTALLYQSGLGIGDALALKYADIRSEFESDVVPVCLDFTSKGRHKTAVEHLTFVSTETVALLKAYFNAEGKPKSDDSLLFEISSRSVEEYYALRAEAIIGKYDGRNPMSPHSLRKFFRKSVVNSGCPESYAEYWEGHGLKSDLRKIYTAMSVDEWRIQYQKYVPALAFKIPNGETKNE